MSWNFRVMEDVEGTLTLREVYYTDGVIVGWTDAVSPMGIPQDGEPPALESLAWELNRMVEALAKPILNEEQLTRNRGLKDPESKA